MRTLLPSKPVTVLATETNAAKLTLKKNEWDEQSKTLLPGFQNYSDGVTVNINR